MTKRDAAFLFFGVVLGLVLFAVFEPPAWGETNKQLERENASLRSENAGLRTIKTDF